MPPYDPEQETFTHYLLTFLFVLILGSLLDDLWQVASTYHRTGNADASGTGER